jgi:hypothetical protein
LIEVNNANKPQQGATTGRAIPRKQLDHIACGWGEVSALYAPRGLAMLTGCSLSNDKSVENVLSAVSRPNDGAEA